MQTDKTARSGLCQFCRLPASHIQGIETGKRMNAAASNTNPKRTQTARRWARMDAPVACLACSGGNVEATTRLL